MPSRTPPIASVSKAFAVLAAVGACPIAPTARQLSAELGSPLPTTYHMLATLLRENMIVRDGSGGYRLGPRVGMLSDAYLEQGEPVTPLESSLNELARTTGETAYLSAWRNGEIEVVATAEGRHAVRVMQVHRGTHGYAHARASGKLLLAFTRASFREHYLKEHPLVGRTVRTITDPALFDDHLDVIRTQGYATDLEEFTLDVSCVSAPVMVRGRIVAAFTVSSPTSRFDRCSDEFVAAAMSIARSAERFFVAGSEAT